MERNMTYTFNDEEIHVLAEALAMYASYQKQCVTPMLVGDESDLEKIFSEASTAESLFYRFYEIDRGTPFEEESAKFQEIHDRPMDISDVSDYDWYEHKHD